MFGGGGGWGGEFESTLTDPSNPLIHTTHPPTTQPPTQPPTRPTNQPSIHPPPRHPNIVNLLDIFEVDANTFATVLELCPGGDLDTHLKEHSVGCVWSDD